MKKISISPSILDSYRVTYQGLYNKTWAQFEQDIIGPRVANEAMSRGTAYHRLIEEGPEKFNRVIIGNTKKDADGNIYPIFGYEVFEKDLNCTWTFSEDAAAPALAIRSKYPEMLHEVKVQYGFSVRGYEIEMRMKFDGLDFAQLHEFKTASRQKTYTDYFDALQWRCYLLPYPEIDSVNYTVFQLNEKNTTCNVQEFKMIREENNEDKVKLWVNGLLYWLESRPHIMDFLEAKAGKAGWMD